MDLERLLVSKVIYTGQVEEALARCIQSEHFADDDCRRVWQYLDQHVRRYKSSPSLDAVRHDFPDFEFLQTQETIEWVLDRFAVLVKRRFADEAILDLARVCDDPDRREEVDIEFLRVAQDLISSLPTGKVSRFSEAERRIKEYEQRKKEGKRLGVPYGIPTLDRALGGIFPHELVTVLGWTNVGKSTLLRVIAFNMWLQGYQVLYFSLEMGADEILREFDALASKLDRQKMKQLDLSETDLNNWKSFAESVSKRSCDISIIDSMYRMTPQQVYAETLRHKPEVVFVDYVGLMRSGSSTRGIQRFQQVSDITQDLKINARMLRIPIVMAAQTNRAGAKAGAELDNAADSVSISQDSDTVIGLYQDEDMERVKEMEIRVPKSRSGPRPKFRMIWNQEGTEFREKTMRDMFGRNGGAPEKEEEHATVR